MNKDNSSKKESINETFLNEKINRRNFLRKAVVTVATTTVVAAGLSAVMNIEKKSDGITIVK